MKCKAGDWVRIRSVVLAPHERAASIPDETRAVPLEMRVKGWLVTNEAVIGDKVEIRSTLGRGYHGTLEAQNPPYGHDFAAAIPELLRAGEELREMLAEPDGESA
ncbi:MAG: 2-amino-4-ketopentanoate thiolase [Pararhodobacter sp.]|nr:2-amino-4-ketopentanoate thiolase [Pararhodobacter sp.]